MSRHAVARTAMVCLALFALALPMWGQDLKSFEERTTVHELANGWTFILVERPTAPVFSFCTVADVGSAQEVPGITGLAHMFEHMAFKGSPTVGTKDYAAEQEAMKAVDKAVAALNAEQDKRERADSARVAQLTAAVKDAEKKAQEYVISNDFSKILEENGALDLNAGTFTDSTQYSFSLPSNRLELWARL